jgi:hypothetical protein
MDAAPAVILVANDAECRHVGGNQTAYATMRQKLGTNLSMAAPEGERPTWFILDSPRRNSRCIIYRLELVRCGSPGLSLQESSV